MSNPELDSLLVYLDRYRDKALAELDGLTDEAVRTELLPHTRLTLIGLLKHLASCEDWWFHTIIGGNPELEPWASCPLDTEPDWDFTSAVTEPLDEVLALFRAARARSDAIVASLADLDTLHAIPDHPAGSLPTRRIIAHMLEEVACHVGHMNLLRDAALGQGLVTAPRD
ncbi:DinB family protein [Micrococcales bacterium 31B]|nr:DinB family protein [Micrococcales bacterium 31B]